MDQDQCVECCGGPTYQIQYSETGQPLYSVPQSVYKRNGMQDQVFTNNNNIRYVCSHAVAPCCCSDPQHQSNSDPRQKTDDYSECRNNLNQAAGSSDPKNSHCLTKLRVNTGPHNSLKKAFSGCLGGRQKPVPTTRGCGDMGGCNARFNKVPTFGGCLAKAGVYRSSRTDNIDVQDHANEHGCKRC